MELEPMNIQEYPNKLKTGYFLSDKFVYLSQLHGVFDIQGYR